MHSGAPDLRSQQRKLPALNGRIGFPDRPAYLIDRAEPGTCVELLPRLRLFVVPRSAAYTPCHLNMVITVLAVLRILVALLAPAVLIRTRHTPDEIVPFGRWPAFSE